LVARTPAAALLARTFRFSATAAADGHDEEKNYKKRRESPHEHRDRTVIDDQNFP
jgi:hypothetical protein